ncbi:MAG TPA: hypothetical protein VM840_00400 [Actinomycetota bacterium]|nr:hypothetical protein [Actinomycetota bacterium]
MRIVTFMAALLVTLGAGPAALAHHDPTHGVAPHTVGDRPTAIHPVGVGTPHPYPAEEELSYEIRVPGVDSLSLHFERYEVEGFYDHFAGECWGGSITISDASSGIVLEQICGTYVVGQDRHLHGNDFWTADLATDHVQLTFSTGSPWREQYGFDIYEVASNGARPVASLPYSSQVSGSVNPQVQYAVDPFDPASSTASAQLGAGAGYGDTSFAFDVSLEHGRYYDCSLYCMEREGSRARAGAGFTAGGQSLDLGGQLALPRDPEGPGGYGAPEPSGRCARNGDACL